MINSFINRLIVSLFLLVSIASLSSCDSEPPTLMKASKQFETDEKRDQHISYMRKNHMDALKHKRDETMYQGIRSKEHSLIACIDCHVPETHNGKVLRHTDQEHFCTTCHTYVAAKLNCFECHVDHPIKIETTLSDTNLFQSSDNKELMDLAFKYATDENQVKNHQPRFTETTLERSNDEPQGMFSLQMNKNIYKGGGMSFDTNGTI